MSCASIQKITMDGIDYRFITNTEIFKHSSWLLNYARLSKIIRFIPILRPTNFEQRPMLSGLDQEFPFPTLIPDSFSLNENSTYVSMFMNVSSTFPIFRFYEIMELAEHIYNQKEISGFDSCKRVIPKNIHCISEKDFYIENEIYSSGNKIRKFIFLPCSRIDYPVSRFTTCTLPYEFCKIDDNLCMARQLSNVKELYNGFACTVENVNKQEASILTFTWDTISELINDPNPDPSYHPALGAHIENNLTRAMDINTISVGNQEEILNSIGEFLSMNYNN